MTFFNFAGAFEIGLIYALVALGVFISFRVLNFPDLTVDGSFPLGGAVAAVLIVMGINPFIATLGAIIAGCTAGYVTAWLNVKLNILPLLASILVMSALYSVNLRVMNGPNVPLLNQETVFTLLNPEIITEFIFKPILLIGILVIVKLILDFFFKSKLGLAIRATGVNAKMARAQGINTNTTVLLGMAISNGLVALAGALYAQSNGGADASMGIGTIVVGLAAVILGENILPARRLWLTTLAVIVGAVVYRIFIALALNASLLPKFLQLKAQDLSLITAVLVAIALVLPQLNLRKKIRNLFKSNTSAT
ncbi:ABC transporter permease [Thorsellia anophelis]|uniref:Putative ABC transport system permease protein n=1 Tax=Thorsellia anophelis DSM 18579 TaxID=1123402 RepID=A0A1I0EHH3_9GAMM|nr:ABC transporter permease [Thorsellia anophelis]SET44783.1 putative ABC transport system permease protein [Thorsellia anophelis DSM 18579]